MARTGEGAEGCNTVTSATFTYLSTFLTELFNVVLDLVCRNACGTRRAQRGSHVVDALKR